MLKMFGESSNERGLFVRIGDQTIDEISESIRSIRLDRRRKDHFGWLEQTIRDEEEQRLFLLELRKESEREVRAVFYLARGQMVRCPPPPP